MPRSVVVKATGARDASGRPSAPLLLWEAAALVAPALLAGALVWAPLLTFCHPVAPAAFLSDHLAQLIVLLGNQTGFLLLAWLRRAEAGRALPFVYAVPAGLGTAAVLVLLGLLYDGVLRLLFGAGTPTLGPWSSVLHLPPLLTVLSLTMGMAVGPLADEWFFRATLFRRWADAGRPWTGALLSAVLFALSRLDLWNFVAYFVLGLALAGLYRRTRALAAVVSAHAALNALMFVLLFSGYQ